MMIDLFHFDVSRISKYRSVVKQTTTARAGSILIASTLLVGTVASPYNFFASYTILPPTTVITGLRSLIESAGTVR